MLYFTSAAKKLCKSLLVVGISFLVPFFAHAATLAVTPVSGSYPVGKTFSIAVNVSSDSQSINAVSGILNFPKDTLEIVSVSKTSSIVGLWVKEPSYSNTTGTASFEGMVLNPGFVGKSGKLLTYTFRVKKEGSATVSLTKGSVLANDGNGTEVFSSAGSGTYTLTKAEAVPEIQKTSPVVTPSETMDSLAVLRITELPRIEDGSVRFSIKVINTKELFTKYELRIDQGQPFIWEDSAGGGQGVFTLPTLPAGQHTLLVKTLDRGTNLTAFADFTIDTLEKPVVTYYTKTAMMGDQVMVYGLANSQNPVTVLLKQKGRVMYQQEVIPHGEGVFTVLFSQEIKKGSYDLEVFAHSSTGVNSETLTGMKIHITSGFFIHIGGVIIEGYIAGIALLGVLIVGVIFSLINRQKKEPLSPQKSL